MIRLLLIGVLTLYTNLSFAHSGRTDGQGGHHDRKNGGYHFHHGMGPHQHPNGVCIYSRSDSTTAKKENFFRRHPVLVTFGAVFLVGYAWSKISSRKNT